MPGDFKVAVRVSDVDRMCLAVMWCENTCGSYWCQSPGHCLCHTGFLLSFIIKGKIMVFSYQIHGPLGKESMGHWLQTSGRRWIHLEPPSPLLFNEAVSLASSCVLCTFPQRSLAQAFQPVTWSPRFLTWNYCTWALRQWTVMSNIVASIFV